jgi:hypothetical protein
LVHFVPTARGSIGFNIRARELVVLNIRTCELLDVGIRGGFQARLFLELLLLHLRVFGGGLEKLLLIRLLRGLGR